MSDNLNWFDAISVLSFVIGFENLQENRAQSEYNDVNLANDKQVHVLLQELDKRFDKIETLLRELKER